MKRTILSVRFLTGATLMATALLASGSITPSAATAATTYYVAKTGSDTNSCTAAQAPATPKLTIKRGLSCLKAGDTLSLRAGTYTETLNNRAQTIPTGTPSAPVTIAAYPGETVILKPSGYAVIQIIGNTHKYLVFDRLVIDGTNITSTRAIDLDGVDQSGAGHIRFTNCEVRNAPGSGVLIGRGSNYHEFLNCDFHHNGRDHVAYGLYVQSSNNRIEGSKLHHNSGYGVHVYNGNPGQRANKNEIKKNLVYNNSTGAPASAGILIGSGDGNLASNNVVYDQPVGIMVGQKESTNSQVYNNTVYNNSLDGIQIRSSSATATVKNNIAYNNGTNIHNYSNGGTTLANNLTTNPTFTNASAADFTLREGSAAINAGASLSQVSDDCNNTPRPQGGSYDIGAYEYTVSHTAAALSAPSNLQIAIQQ